MQKYILSIFLLTLSCTGDTALVTARDGLYVRDKPDPKSKKLDILPKGTKVKILFVDEKRYNLYGKEAAFAFVQFKGDKRGYVYSAFLTSTSSGNIPLILNLLLAIVGTVLIAYLVYRYRQKLKTLSQRAIDATKQSLETYRAEKKHKADLQKIEAELRAEISKKAAKDKPRIQNEDIGKRIQLRNLAGIKTILFVMLLILLAINNPSKTDFAQYISEQISAEISNKTDSFDKALLSAGKVIGLDIEKGGVDFLTNQVLQRTRSQDCVIFSLYWVSAPNQQILVIGVIKRFIPIPIR